MNEARKFVLFSAALAATTTAAVMFAFLWRDAAASHELGVVQVLVQEDKSLPPDSPLLQGKRAATMHVVIAEAPIEQNDTVSPGAQHSGVVYYPMPFTVPPNLKLTCGRRLYVVTEEDETHFAWSAKPLAEDFRADRVEAADTTVDDLLSKTFDFVSDKMKPGIRYEDFTWQAKGMRGDAASPQKPEAKLFAEGGDFMTIAKQEGIVFFPIPYASPPNVEITGGNNVSTLVCECTAQSFKWKNTGEAATSWNQGEVSWRSRGVLPEQHAK